jgi:hypothetical protein
VVDLLQEAKITAKRWDRVQENARKKGRFPNIQ